MDHINFARRLLIVIFGVTLTVFWLEAAWDFSQAIDPVTGQHIDLWTLRATPNMVRSLASSFGGAYATMIAMLLTFISLAIPITANLYSPKLINIFIRDPINLFVICTCAILAAHNLFAVALSFDQWTAQLPFAIAVGGAITGWLLLLPYYFYVVSFIDPLTIIERSRRTLERSLDVAAKGKLPNLVAQQRVNENIHNLGSVLLRAADRADRDVTLDAARTHIFEINRMRSLKLDLPVAFLHVDNDVLAGMGGAAAIIVSEQKIWVEHQIAHQLVMAFKVVLTRMPDGVSAMAQMVKNAAHEHARVRNDEVFFLLVRILNSFTREAIKKRENAPVCSVIYSYRTLVRRMLVDRPELIPPLLRYLRFYADFANRQGLPFIYGRMSYELCELAEYAYDYRMPLARELLDTVLALEGAEGNVGLVKSRAILASYFIEREMMQEYDLVLDSLKDAPPALVDQARGDMLFSIERVFWEVNDHGVNFDYVDPKRRGRVIQVFERLNAPAILASDRTGDVVRKDAAD